MNIFKEFRQHIIKIVQDLEPHIDKSTKENIVMESPKDPSHGDLSTNAAMILASSYRLNPQDVAKSIQEKIAELPDVESVTIAGPGFINIALKNAKWHEQLLEIIKLGSSYGDCNLGKNRTVNVEYVSCNPTGPMHIGHARGAVYGDVLANILKRCGYSVVKEFYINDAGSQIETLARTALLRYKQAITGEEAQIPEGFYPGQYLIPVGQNLAKEYGTDLSEDDLELIKKFTVLQMMEMIKDDLANLGIKHDVFFSEKTLHNGNKIEHIIKKLIQDGFIYTGVLPPPKGKLHKEWDTKKQLLFKTTSFGDSQDRPLQKGDSSWTYFAAEVAYFEDKINRGFDKMVLILGADHAGYIKRSESVVKAIDSSRECIIKTCQLVNFVQDGAPLKMSKRSGDFVTAKDIVDLVGKDVIRFMMLTRRNDAVIDFDVVKVVEMSKDNPVFYVQYAHVRSCSILKNAAENEPESFAKFQQGNVSIDLLSLNEELALIKNLASWPKVLESSALFFEPHRIAFYLQSLASDFHALWNLNTADEGYRFILKDQDETTAARLMLCKAVSIIIDQGLKIMGVEAMEKM